LFLLFVLFRCLAGRTPFSFSLFVGQFLFFPFFFFSFLSRVVNGKLSVVLIICVSVTCEKVCYLHYPREALLLSYFPLFFLCFIGGSSAARGGRAPPSLTCPKDLVRVTLREGQGKLCLRKEIHRQIDR
jgi:hypothetical protein